jgi:hypothetical protein
MSSVVNPDLGNKMIKTSFATVFFFLALIAVVLAQEQSPLVEDAKKSEDNSLYLLRGERKLYSYYSKPSKPTGYSKPSKPSDYSKPSKPSGYSKPSKPSDDYSKPSKPSDDYSKPSKPYYPAPVKKPTRPIWYRP